MASSVSFLTTLKYLEYKGYYGTIEVNYDDKLLHGKVVGVGDYILYQGSTIEELEKDFQESINEYLDTCKEIGKEPEKSFSGKLMLRVPPDLHSKIAINAQQCGKSINAWLNDVVGKAIDSSDKHGCNHSHA